MSTLNEKKDDLKDARGFGRFRDRLVFTSHNRDYYQKRSNDMGAQQSMGTKWMRADTVGHAHTLHGSTDKPVYLVFETTPRIRRTLLGYLDSCRVPKEIFGVRMKQCCPTHPNP